MIIGLGGEGGSGKDTAANILVKNHGFVKVAFADEIKRTAARLYPKMTREHLWGPSSKRAEPLLDYPRKHGSWVSTKDGYRCACCNIFQPGSSEKQCYLTTRFALQRLGTEGVRDCYENVWVDIVVDAAHKLLHMNGIARSLFYSYTPWDGLITTNVPDGPRPMGVAISDLRWPNGSEGEGIRAAGGQLWKMKYGDGLGGAASTHRSESEVRAVPDAFYDVTVDNRAFTLDELEANIAELVKIHVPDRRKKKTS